MNAAHWHLLVNHFPIVGSFITLLVLLHGIVRRQYPVIKLAYLLFILMAVFSIIATQTGESAETYLKSIHALDETIEEVHVQAAGTANYALIAVGVVALLALVVKRLRTFKYMPWIVLVLSLTAFLLVARAGNLGGKIMHKEIRSDQINILPVK